MEIGECSEIGGTMYIYITMNNSSKKYAKLEFGARYVSSFTKRTLSLYIYNHLRKRE